MIDDNTILQADAAVIAGALILLTIYSFKYPENALDNRRQTFLAISIITTIFLFSSSCVCLIVVALEPKLANVNQLGYGFAGVGFAALLVWISAFVLIHPMFHSKRMQSGE